MRWSLLDTLYLLPLLVHRLLPRCLPVALVWARQEVGSSSGGEGVGYMPGVLYDMSCDMSWSCILCHDSLPHVMTLCLTMPITHVPITHVLIRHVPITDVHVGKGEPRTQAPKQRCIV